MANKFTVIGIDPSLTSLGLVVINQEGVVIEYHKITSLLPKEYLEDRLIDLETQVCDIIQAHRPIAVGIEGLSYGSVSSSTRDLAQLYGVLSTTIRKEFDLHLRVYAPTSVKKFATGNGKASKQQMVDALPEEIKILFSNHYKKSTGLYDLTDAYYIAQMALKEIKGELF